MKVVNIKTAQLAHEKGFRSDLEYVFNTWLPEEVLEITINQLLEWLREELKINVYCRIMESQWSVYIESIPSGVDITPHSLICIDFTSYESAIEAGIQAAISL